MIVTASSGLGGVHLLNAEATGLRRTQDTGLVDEEVSDDKAYDDAGTLKRVRQDLADGKALGVTGTPTFFLNGKMFDPTSYEHIVQSIDAALAS